MTDKNTIISAYGLDISSTTIKWEGWRPNKKYSDNIVISNLNTKTVNIKIKALPKSKYFQVNDNNNDIVKIRGGHSKKININFLPLEIQNYSDQILFAICPNNSCEESNEITISLNADIPKTSLQIPSEIDFGFLAVKEEANVQFEMINNGDTQLNFNWIATNSPLVFTPNTGIINNKSQIINIQFTPQSASCVEMKVPLQININNNNKHKEIMYMTVKAICTYPFFKISTDIVDMGAISIGDCKRKKLKIENCSPVSALIHIKNDKNINKNSNNNENKIESVFSINPNSLIKIKKHSFIEIEIQFKPRTVGVKYTEHYIIDTLCGYKVRFQINGKADSPKISTDVNLINFKSVEINKFKTDTFILTNHSSIDSHFEFMNCGESEISKSSFILSPKRGKIFANEAVVITVRFKPNNVMLYGKEIYCTIHHHIPLFIQLIGVGIDDKTKFILEPQFNKLENEIIQKLETNKIKKTDKYYTNMSHKLFTKLFDENASEKYMKISTNIIEFESCSLSQGIAPYHDITLFNVDKTNLISIKWDIESTNKNNKSNKRKAEFAVFPPFMDIRALSSADFSAAFQPTMDLMYFYECIDCYYFYKNNDKKLALKCASIDLFGHSFGAKSTNHFDANVALSTNVIEFTPCSLGSSIYATIKIRNLSDKYPTIWKIENEENKENEEHQSFDFYPIQGYIPPNTFQLIVTKFKPLKQGITTFSTNIKFNQSENNLKPLQLIGIAVEPKLHFKNNEIYVIPTCIGMTSIEHIQLYNYSPIPIHYEWKIPEQYLKDNIISLEPMNGILDINEKKKSILRFSPNKLSGNYVIECQCYYGNTTEMGYFETLKINACCNQSIIEFIPKQSDFNSILIDCQTTKSVSIQNNADCQLNCDFYIEPNSPNSEIKPSRNNLYIPPKTRKQLELDINAIHPGMHEYKLIAKVKRIDGNGSINSLSDIQFNAIWPTLSVIDIQCNDMLLSKENLWSKFSINELNKTFLSDLTKFERNWNNVNVEKENMVGNDNLNNILKHKFANISFNFGTKQLYEYMYKDNETKILLKVYNKSSISATINLKSVNQLLCKPEHWVENNNKSCNDENDNYLFEIEPKHFELEANKSQIVSFTYCHKMCGEHQTKILLSIQNGKQITLNLFGETTANNYYPRLSIPFNTIYLKSQQIGLLNKDIVTQFVPIKNLSNHDLLYSVDTNSVNKINNENYNFNIFQVMNLQGIIKKNETIYLQITFQPIEVKKYSFNLRINAEINDKEIENPEATFINIAIVANGINNNDAVAVEDECFGRMYDIKNMIKLPNCNGRLSTQVLNFGVIPLRANIRKFITIYNERNDCSTQFRWNKLIPCVSVKEMQGEIQPNASIACEVCIRSEIEASIINDCVSCLMWNNKYEWTLYLKINCCILTDSQFAKMKDLNDPNMIIQSNIIQTDKPIAISTSLLSPKSQKQMSKMRNEADVVSIECCKALMLKALSSQIVEDQLSELPSYKVPIAMEMETKNKTMAWQQIKEELNDNWDKKKKLLKETEFHDFLEYVMSETVFNLAAEMLENTFYSENDKEQ